MEKIDLTQRLWSEKYRPQTLGDCILLKENKLLFNQCLKNKFIPNYIFYGSPGIGKTTVAKALMNDGHYNYKAVNGSMYGNIDTLRTDIKEYASTYSLLNDRKYVIIDEADYLNPNSTQPAFRAFLDECSEVCGFILSVNYVNKIIEPLRSRFEEISFDIQRGNLGDVGNLYLKRLQYILETENISFSKKILAEVIIQHFPDLRKTINKLQTYAIKHNTIDSGILTTHSNETDELLELIKSKDYQAASVWVLNKSNTYGEVFYNNLYQSASDRLTSQDMIEFVDILGEYMYRESFVANKYINTLAMVANMIVRVNFS